MGQAAALSACSRSRLRGDAQGICMGKGAGMSIATMTSKGQITIPKDIREGLGLKPKDQLRASFL